MVVQTEAQHCMEAMGEGKYYFSLLRAVKSQKRVSTNFLGDYLYLCLYLYLYLYLYLLIVYTLSAVSMSMAKSVCSIYRYL